MNYTFKIGDGDRDFSESPPIDMGSGEFEVDFRSLHLTIQKIIPIAFWW